MSQKKSDQTPAPGEAAVAPSLAGVPIPDPANTPAPGEALPPPSSVKAPDIAPKEHAGEPAPGVPVTSPSAPQHDQAIALAQADASGKGRTAYQIKETGSTVGAISGTAYTYTANQVIEAPDGDLDHLGGAAVKYQTRIATPDA